MATHFIKKIPNGDSKLRDICNKCSFVNYENPRVVVGSVPVRADDSVQLVFHDGAWTLPYDFMRVGETSKQGAARVTGGAKVNADHLLSFDEMPEEGLVVMTFRVMADQALTNGVFFEIERAKDKLAGNPAALHALEVYQQTKKMKRFEPGFLRHGFNGVSGHALGMLHVPPEAGRAPARECGGCDFDKRPKVKIVTGVVASLGDKILLAKRAIEPRIGYWTLPAGFMELGETLREGAARETDEETGAEVEVGKLLAIYEIPEFGQVMPVFRGILTSGKMMAGTESQAVGLFSWDEIREKEQMGAFAFQMVKDALNKFDIYKNSPLVLPGHRRLHPSISG